MPTGTLVLLPVLGLGSFSVALVLLWVGLGLLWCCKKHVRGLLSACFGFTSLRMVDFHCGLLGFQGALGWARFALGALGGLLLVGWLWFAFGFLSVWSGSHLVFLGFAFG